jgi:uncharacterized protein YxjI
LHERFNHRTYLIRRKVLQLFGATFHVYDPAGQVALYARLKAFKLKEDIRLYTGEEMQTEVLKIQARQMIDFAAAYDVYDSQTGEKVGALKRKGWKSLLRDEWVLMDVDDRELGRVQEESMLLALVRRFVLNLIPQTFYATVDGVRSCKFVQNFNPFVSKLTVDFAENAQGQLDPRLGIAAGILLLAIDGKQR